MTPERVRIERFSYHRACSHTPNAQQWRVGDDTDCLVCRSGGVAADVRTEPNTATPRHTTAGAVCALQQLALFDVAHSSSWLLDWRGVGG